MDEIKLRLPAETVRTVLMRHVLRAHGIAEDPNKGYDVLCIPREDGSADIEIRDTDDEACCQR